MVALSCGCGLRPARLTLYSVMVGKEACPCEGRGPTMTADRARCDGGVGCTQEATAGRPRRNSPGPGLVEICPFRAYRVGLVGARGRAWRANGVRRAGGV